MRIILKKNPKLANESANLKHEPTSSTASLEKSVAVMDS